MKVVVAGTATLPPRPTAAVDIIASSDAAATAYFYTATPNAPLDPSIGKVSISNAVPMSDVITEMSLGLGGGGGDDPCFTSVDKNGQVPTSFPAASECLLMQPAAFELNWDENQTVTFTVTDPTGRSFRRILSPSQYGGFLAQYQPRLDAPTGRWSFEIRGAALTYRHQIHFTRPQGAQIYLLGDDPFLPVRKTDAPPYRILLDGFRPNEAARLMAYQVILQGPTQADLEFAGWQDVQVGANGSLLLQSDAAMRYYLAYGKQSGEVHMPYDLRGLADIFPDKQLYCPGALLPRLKKYTGGQVTYTDGRPLRIHSSPGVSTAVVDNLPEGAPFRVADGPKCAGGAFWWQIYTEQSGEGWIAESQGSIYLVEPQKP